MLYPFLMRVFSIIRRVISIRNSKTSSDKKDSIISSSEMVNRVKREGEICSKLKNKYNNKKDKQTLRISDPRNCVELQTATSGFKIKDPVFFFVSTWARGFTPIFTRDCK